MQLPDHIEAVFVHADASLELRTRTPKTDSPPDIVPLSLPADALSISTDGRRSGTVISSQTREDVDAVLLELPSLRADVGANVRILVPGRMGRLLTAPSDDSVQTFPTYGGKETYYSMAMVAYVGEEHSVLVHWDDPDVGFDLMGADGHLRLRFRVPNARVSIEILPYANLSRLADHYRDVLKDQGRLTSYARKTELRPEAAKLPGAALFRPLCFSRFVPNARLNPDADEKLFVDYTFADVGSIAEHWRRDLEIERAHVLISGWTTRGYDNQHPDVMPAAAECGGNDGLADAVSRMRALGYIVGLHDNYNAMYLDAPSWDEAALRYHENGTPYLGGEWAGGRPRFLCPVKGLELAERNVPEVAEAFPLNAYFLDVIYAAYLRDCHHPDHPLTLAGDRDAKRELVDYIHQHFDIFGSEGGVEWGANDAEFFEGILTEYMDPEIRDRVFPWFEMVFHDAVQMYTHAWDRATPDRNDYITSCVSLAHMPSYGLPNGAYFDIDPSDWTWSALHHYYGPKHARIPGNRMEFDESTCAFARGDDGWAADLCLVDRFVKNTYEVLSPLTRLCADKRLTRFDRRSDGVLLTRFESDDDEGVEIAVNTGEANATWHDCVLPSHGFIVEHPRFLAVHALSWNGRTYDRPVLFTFESEDGRDVTKSGAVRVYHGFGSPEFELAGRGFSVSREEVVSPQR